MMDIWRPGFWSWFCHCQWSSLSLCFLTYEMETVSLLNSVASCVDRSNGFTIILKKTQRQNLSASSLFGRESQKTLVQKWGFEIGKGRMSIERALIGIQLLWTTGVPSCCGLLGECIDSMTYSCPTWEARKLCISVLVQLWGTNSMAVPGFPT